MLNRVEIVLISVEWWNWRWKICLINLKNGEKYTNPIKLADLCLKTNRIPEIPERNLIKTMDFFRTCIEKCVKITFRKKDCYKNQIKLAKWGGKYLRNSQNICKNE